MNYVIISEYGKLYYGDSKVDAVSQMVDVHITKLVEGNFSVKIKVVGYPIRDWHGYSKDWTEEEVVRDVLKSVVNNMEKGSTFDDFKLYQQC